MSGKSADQVGMRGGEVSLAALSSILVHGPISRTELTLSLGLSPSTMTRAVKPLIDRGLVREVADQLEGPGRPSRPLVGNPGAHRFVGIKLTGDEVYGVATDLLANEVGEARLPLTSHAPVVVADAVAEVVHKLVPDGVIDAIGLALGGSTSDGRMVDRAPFLDWRGVPLANMLESQLEAPVVIDNDLAALTAGEHWFGVARGIRDFAVVTLGAGVGSGLVRGDAVVRTHDMGLGLAGHIPLDPLGPRCMLGHRGCSTAVLSIPSIEASASVALRRNVHFAEVIELAQAGNAACYEVVEASAIGLGRLIALVANLAMIDVIVLSGEGLAVLDVAEAQMRQELRDNRDPDAAILDIRIDRAGFPQWARGAATVAIQWSLRQLIESPIP